MDKTLTSQFFIGNRTKLFSSLKSDVLILTASGVFQKTSDEGFPFSQDTSFWYLTGINEPDLIFVKTKTEEFIVVPKHFVSRQSHVKPLNNQELTKTSGISQILDEKEGWAKIKTSLDGKTSYASFSPNPVLLKFHGLYTNPARKQLVTKIKRLFPKLELEDARKLVAGQRMLKQPVETALIQKAIDITKDTLKEVLAKDNLTKYKTTEQIKDAITNGFIARGADGHGFDPVVSCGANTALIHYTEPTAIKSGDLIVCDVGARYSFYQADITRTVIYGQPSARQLEVYEAVKRVQTKAFKMIKAGMDFKKYEDKVTELIGEELIKLGLIKELDRKSIRKYYMTYCSHSLGLDTHDAADYPMPLPENMVMTVEPGIYIEEEGIGVRIEDDVQITKDGYRLLSSGLSNSLNL